MAANYEAVMGAFRKLRIVANSLAEVAIRLTVASMVSSKRRGNSYLPRGNGAPGNQEAQLEG